MHVTPPSRLARNPDRWFPRGMNTRDPGGVPPLVVLDAGAEPGALAMDREVGLAERARAGDGPRWILRFHGWAVPTLSLGKTQHVPRALPGDARGAGVSVVRRPTGGGWLLHVPGDLAVTLVARGPLRAGELRGTARLLGEAIAAALDRLGLAARAAVAAASPRGAGRAEVCFQRVDREEVSAGSTKVAGVALARVGRAALVQAAIPLVPAAGKLAGFEARWDPRRREAVIRTAGIDADLLAETIEARVAEMLPAEAGEREAG